MVQGVLISPSTLSFLEKGKGEITEAIKWGKVSANFSIRWFHECVVKRLFKGFVLSTCYELQSTGMFGCSALFAMRFVSRTVWAKLGAAWTIFLQSVKENPDYLTSDCWWSLWRFYYIFWDHFFSLAVCWSEMSIPATTSTTTNLLAHTAFCCYWVVFACIIVLHNVYWKSLYVHL